MKTWSAKPGEVLKKWWLVDAEGKTLGRISTEISRVLRGKKKPEFTPHVDTGDFVVVINSDKIKLTGNKWLGKKYYTRSKYFGSLKEWSAEKIREKDSRLLVMTAVKGMMPNNKLATKQLTKLKVFKDANHKHQAQKLEALNIERKH